MGDFNLLKPGEKGTDSDITFHAQSTHVFKLEDGSGRIVFMADRWNRKSFQS